MKKLLTTGLILALLIWNSVLTYEVFFNQKTDTTVNPDETVVQTVVTEFDTDVTRVVETSIEKVVGIQSIQFDEVFSTGSGAIFDSKDGLVHIVTNNHVVENASKIAQKYGFSYIETPLLEETALFKRSVGESSDIVNKEMYQFIDKGQNDVCLRPEGTAGVVRHFVEKKLDRAGGTYKWYYYGPMFRYERPQKGRLREFHQFGCEVFGISNVYEDANIIMLIREILEYFGIGFTLKLNSLGCVECMPQYKNNLVNHLNSFKSELCEDCNRRVDTNPIRVLDCKNEKCQTLLKDAPKITNSLCSSCDSDFEKLKEILDFNKINYEIDSNLVRGLDY